jgi:hypothetical protein
MRYLTGTAVPTSPSNRLAGIKMGNLPALDLNSRQKWSIDREAEQFKEYQPHGLIESTTLRKGSLARACGRS